MQFRSIHLKWVLFLIIVVGVIVLSILVIIRTFKEESSILDKEDESSQYKVKTVVDEQGVDQSFDYMTFIDGEGGVFEQDQEIVLVGEETLYGNDLNIKIWANHVGRVENQWDIRQEDIERYVDELIFESKLLQIGREFGVIELSEMSFNRQVKDYKDRNALIDKVREYVEESEIEKVSFETVSMWFYNMTPPEMGVEEAKSIVYSKIVDLYERVVIGEISMKEAGEHIKQDKQQAAIDEAYIVNAYVKVEDESVQSPHFTPKIVEKAASLKEGEVSEVILETCSFSDEVVDVEAYYYFVENIGYKGGSGNIESWVDKHFSGEIKVLLASVSYDSEVKTMPVVYSGKEV